MSDPYFSNVVLLVGNDNAANGSTTFTDQSSAANVPTANGGIAYTNAQAPTGMTTSIGFNGSTQYLNYASDADFGFGTGDFTVEFMMRTTTDGNFDLADFRTAEPSVRIDPYIAASGKLSTWVNGADQITQNTVYSINTWYHIAYCKASGTSRMFVNGTQIGSNASDANNYGANSTLFFGASFNTAKFFPGWMSNLRVTKGVARYTSNFTPDSLPWPLAGPVITINLTESIEGTITYATQIDSYRSKGQIGGDGI